MKWLAFPWNPNSLQRWSSLMNEVLFQSFYFFAARFYIKRLPLKATESQQAVLIGLHSDVAPRFRGVPLAVTSIWGEPCCKPTFSIALDKICVLCYISVGSFVKLASMFDKIRSPRLRICDWSQGFCIGWLIVGDGVSCCGKGHAGSITAQGRCGHA